MVLQEDLYHKIKNMKNRKNIVKIVLGVLLIVAFGCNNSKDKSSKNPEDAIVSSEKNEVIDEQTSQNTLDWNGTYTGVLPCADCDGIKTKITLLKDGTFFKCCEYLGKKENAFFENGTFVWNDAGNIVTLTGKNGKKQQYKVGENVLFHLDKEGNVITGDLAGKYKLMKNFCDSSLEDTKWVLVELKGQPIGPSSAPYVIFDSEKAMVSGKDGCNNFSGAYELKEGWRIDIREDKAMSTTMACDNMEIAILFIKVLGMSDNYAVKDGVLSLSKARMAPLAKFNEAKE